jgi:uncharacterized protein DUF4019
MNKCCTIIVTTLILSCIAFSQSAAEKTAVNSGDKWLALVDAGDYGASWDEAAQMFKNAVSKEQWTQTANAVRTPLGKLNSRRLKSATYKTTLPGAPDGQYVVVQYDTSFEHKKAAVETVTTTLDKDGHWRVSGYFIR